MKYLVNRETKEHRIDHCPEAEVSAGWYRIEADAEGWIPWSGGECPLPDGALCDVKYRMVAYRPTLDGKPQETPAQDLGLEQQCNDLLTRLKAAHEAAQRIPDIIAELRELLEPMGLGVVYLTELRTDDPEPDMTDWRNWRAGDLVERVCDPVPKCAVLGGVYKVTRVETSKGGTNRVWYICEDGAEVFSYPNNFRWHSRPTKEPKA